MPATPPRPRPRSRQRRAVYTASDTKSPRTSPRLSTPGDRIQLNYEGPWYLITGVQTTSVNFSLDPIRSAEPESAGAVEQYADNGVLPHLPPCRTDASLVTKSVASPLQLPAGAVIDLTARGPTTPGPRQPGFLRHGARSTSCFRPRGPSKASIHLYQGSNSTGAHQHADLSAGGQAGQGPRPRPTPASRQTTRIWKHLGGHQSAERPRDGCAGGGGQLGFGQPQHGPRCPTHKRMVT